jgi:predicted transcriptional regulator
MKHVVSKIMLILKLLSNGEWRGIDEMLLEARLSDDKLQDIMGFLSKYGFVEIDEQNRKLRVNRDFQRLLVQPIT